MSVVSAGRPTVGTLLLGATQQLRASGSASARLDAEVLLGHVLGVDRTVVITHPEAPVSIGQAEALAIALRRRASGEPVAYIRGFKEFRGIALSVDARALIPRPESELLVELAIDRVREVLTGGSHDASRGPFRIWDVGTGSGSIAIAIAVWLVAGGYGDTFHVIASDASADALSLAVENTVPHGVADRIDFAQGDLLTVRPPVTEPVDLLVANLPYIPSAAVSKLPIAASFEPRSALDGGVDGLEIIRRLLPALPAALIRGGVALLEIGSDQADAAVRAVASHLPGWASTVLRDLAGHPRVVRLTEGPAAPRTGLVTART